MAYWWVSHRQTVKEERQGGFLWAPKRTGAGGTFFHWENMLHVRPGDIVFSYAGKKIGAVGVAKSAAFDAKEPDFLKGGWEKDGRRVDVSFDAISPVSLSSIRAGLLPLLPTKYSPMTSMGVGTQGYLFSLPPEAGEFLLGIIGKEKSERLIAQQIEQDKTVPATQRLAIVQARVGQGPWRDKLMTHWLGRCAVTGLDISPLLRASHIKPWRSGNNSERLDPANGLLLAPQYDAAFDCGYVTFDEDGRIRFSPKLSSANAAALGLTAPARITALSAGHHFYLQHHRAHVFVR